MNDYQIYKKATQLLKNSENIALATVISTTGSTPGKLGYKMLVWGKKPQTFGTVGGGLSESRVINAAAKNLSKIQSLIIKAELDGTQDGEKGICGGAIEFLIETFDKKNVSFFERISKCLENSQKGISLSIISSDGPGEKVFLDNTEQVETCSDLNVTPKGIELIKAAFNNEVCEKIILNNNLQIFVESISAEQMVYIFGAGHMAYYITKFAKAADFRVTICDDRPQFANKQRFPDADNIIVESYETVFDKLNIDENSYIVIVTKGHKDDQKVLGKSVKTKAGYIGMIGSKRKALALFQSLSQKGISRNDLKKVYAPIGISIGAISPEEIAISIVSELIKIKRQPKSSAIDHMKISF